jgi:hypothetical protein
VHVFFQIALETILLPVHIYKYIYIYFSFNPIKNYAMHASTFYNVARINIVLTQDTYKSYTFMFLFLLNHFYSDIFAFLPVYHTSERQNILIETNSPGPYYIYSYLPYTRTVLHIQLLAKAQKIPLQTFPTTCYMFHLRCKCVN